MIIEITDNGHLFTEVNRHRTNYKPNVTLPEEVAKEAEKHPDFNKYRTQENADAYEAKLVEQLPSDEEIQAQKEREAEQEARNIAIEEIIAERTQTALDNVKNEIALGKVEDARKAVRDKHKKLKG